jgi:hypothetical protein
MEGQRFRGAGGSWAILLGFVGIYFILFSPVLLSGKFLAPGDASSYSLPMFYSARSPWTPFMFSGFPRMADPQAMTWYPLALLFRWLPQGWNVFILSAYVLATAFVFGYVSRLTQSLLAGAVSGLTFGMSGFMIIRASHVQILHCSAWLPLLIWSLEELRTRASLGWLAAGALAMASLALGGHPQILVYGTGLAALYAVAASWRAPVGTWRYLASASIILALGLGLAAIQLVPTLEMVLVSTRAHLNFATYARASLPLRQLPELIFPYAYGGAFSPTISTPYFGHRNQTELTGYMGLLPLVLAGIGATKGTNRRLRRFWSLTAVAGLLLALGSEVPLAALLFRVPGYNLFRAPARHLLELSLAVSVLGGLGTASLAQMPVVERRRTLLRAAMALFAIVAIGWLVFWRLLVSGSLSAAMAAVHAQVVSASPWNNPAIAVPFVQLAIALTTVFLVGRRFNAASSMLLVAALLADLGSFAWLAPWRASAWGPAILQAPPPLSPYLRRLAESGQRLTSISGSGIAADLDAAPANYHLLWRLSSVVGYNPLLIARYHGLTDIRAHGFSSFHSLRSEDRGLDILSSRYVLVPKDVLRQGARGFRPEVVTDLQHSRFVRIDELPSSFVYENLHALPRAWIVPHVLRLPSAAIRRAIRTSSLPDGQAYDPSTTALIEQPVHLDQESGDLHAAVHLIRLSDTEVELSTESTTNAFLVVSDIYYRGWRVFLDDRPAEVYLADYVLRGLELPAGRHSVRFEFRPASYRLGAAVSCVSLLCWAGLLVGSIVGTRSAPSFPAM